MSDITKPMALDETLQDVADALDVVVVAGNAYQNAVSGGYSMPESQFNRDLEVMKWRCNPNLLDNWYFVGGGDQQGGGQFPINQRKQTSSSGYMVYPCDRWRLPSAGYTAAILSTGIKLTVLSSAGVANMFNQPLENVADIAGKPFTFSCLITENTTTKGVALRLGASQPATCLGTGLFSYTGSAYSANHNTAGLAAIDRNTDNGKYVVVAAMKLELGEEQTLAHLENGVWVLNEIPDYTTQLLRCQRFYRVFTSTSTSTTGYGYSTNPKNLRPEMRATPSTGSFTSNGITYYYLDANL